ncbi:MAG: methionyl-tRNA formyltransferase [Gammaproteobacteria bacterium]|nr:methionyl-tRNA formyltransferase [Gammaproteobacteria bacterium]
MSSLRIIFAGTPDFAAISLMALIESEHEVVAVYSQPDRPAGRGRKLRASPVKEVALKYNIPVYQPEKLKDIDAQEELRSLNADVMVVAAYGLLLPQAVLDIPKFGCLNIHASLLPRWRGAAPIQRAIAAGDKESGISIMQMNAGLDTGDILQLSSCPITEQDNGGSLHDKLAEIGASAILETLNNVANHSLNPVVQDDALATYAHKLDKKEAQINWQNSAVEIERLVRAFNPWPVAYTRHEDKTLRIWQAKVIELNSPTKTNYKPGTVVSCDKKGIDVICGEGILRILNLQPSGSKAMDVAAFMNGHAKQLPVGSVFQNPA